MINFAIGFMPQSKKAGKTGLKVITYGQEQTMFQEVYDHYYRVMVGYAFRFLKSETDAEDTVQDVFATLWSKHASPLDKRELVRLLYTSIHNRCIDVLKHQAVEKAYTSGVENGIEESIEAEIFSAELYNRIFQHIDSLPARQRDTIVKALEGKSNAQIAEEMQVSIETVKNQKHKAITQLRKAFTGDKQLLMIAILEAIISE